MRYSILLVFLIVTHTLCAESITGFWNVLLGEQSSSVYEKLNNRSKKSNGKKMKLYVEMLD